MAAVLVPHRALLHSTVCEYSSDFWALTTVNKAATNDLVRVFQWQYARISVGHKPTGGIAG